MKRTIRPLIIIASLGLITLVAWTIPSQTPWQEKISPVLAEKMRSNEPVNFMVLLRAEADISGAKTFRTKSEKASYVFNQLQSTAKVSQTALIEILNSHNVKFQSFYIVNAIQATGEKSLIETIARQPEVEKIMYNPSLQLNDIPEEYIASSRGIEGIEWGIDMINADEVWDMGYTGQGVVVGGQDTGYEWFHPAIKAQYRGWDGAAEDHNYNWHDAIHEISPLHNDPVIDPSNNPCGLDSNVPCDDHNHGTHTMGTMVGDDGGDNQIGVAPGARWIACRNMERGYGSPSTYIECFEWFLAPTDTANLNPDPTKAPHVINNSWSCPEMEGCIPDNWSLMEIAVTNLRASGVVVVVSAGNSGSQGCGSVNTPAAMFEDSFTIGSTKSDDELSNFSSRGPVTIDSSMRMKPDVTAPGSSVRSCVRGGAYSTFSGTSMAGPHVAGLVALVTSANPELAGNVDEIESIIRQSAVKKNSDENCGNDDGMIIPNNKYGYGRVDALAAVQLAVGSSTETEEALLPADVKVYPNPLESFVQFELPPHSGEVTLEIFNGAAQRIIIEHFESVAGTKTIDTSEFAPGIYFYKISGAGQHSSGKLIKH